VAKAIHIVGIEGLLYRLTILNLRIPSPSTDLSDVIPRRQIDSSQFAGCMTHGGLGPPVLFSLYVKDIPSVSSYIALDDTADIATSD
jgi:hypothetical protein